MVVDVGRVSTPCAGRNLWQAAPFGEYKAGQVASEAAPYYSRRGSGHGPEAPYCALWHFEWWDVSESLGNWQGSAFIKQWQVRLQLKNSAVLLEMSSRSQPAAPYCALCHVKLLASMARLASMYTWEGKGESVLKIIELIQKRPLCIAKSLCLYYCKGLILSC